MTALRILLRTLRAWNDHRDSAMGAALAYYTLFSLAPFLLIAIDVAGAVFQQEEVLPRIEQYVSQNVSKEAASAMRAIADQAERTHQEGGAAILGIALLVFGSLGTFLHLRTSFCDIWELKAPEGNSVVEFVMNYVFALFGAVTIVALLLAALAVSLFAPIVRVVLKQWFSEYEADLWSLVEFAGGFIFLTLIFAALYRVLSGRRVTWRHSLTGAAFAAILFTLGKFGVDFWLSRSATATSFGVFSSLVVLLIWLWFSAQVIFLGAELIQAIRTPWRAEAKSASPTN
ncbi:MAG: YihY/virulence factor BrkB family protein [Gemmataceae bacterium]|nr:YihY/virulence factor BrkB family protein [Gemmataceae bacterium]